MKPGAKDKHLFYMEMAKLLEAGFDIRKAADVLANTRIPAAQKVLLKSLKAGLADGETIAGAFSKDTETVTSLERSILEAGEKGGKLAPAFQHLADYFQMLASARRGMIKGMIYPLIVLHLGIFVGTVPLAVMREEKTPGEIVWGLVIAFLIFYAGCVGAFFLGKFLLKRAPGDAMVDGLIGRIPWVGKARKEMAMSRFCKVYHACLLAGISMVKTVRVSTEAAKSGRIAEAGARIEKVAEQGGLLGPGFLAEKVFPESFARSYATGEESGTLDKDLGNWARIFQKNSEEAMKSAAVMVPKVLYIFIMAYVGWKIVGFFTGYYSELDGLLG
ncbi:MAG: type II secretion system F family protein [Luteolibacter sp.]